MSVSVLYSVSLCAPNESPWVRLMVELLCTHRWAPSLVGEMAGFHLPAGPSWGPLCMRKCRGQSCDHSVKLKAQGRDTGGAAWGGEHRGRP